MFLDWWVVSHKHEINLYLLLDLSIEPFDILIIHQRVLVPTKDPLPVVYSPQQKGSWCPLDPSTHSVQVWFANKEDPESFETKISFKCCEICLLLAELEQPQPQQLSGGYVPVPSPSHVGMDVNHQPYTKWLQLMTPKASHFLQSMFLFFIQIFMLCFPFAHSAVECWSCVVSEIKGKTDVQQNKNKIYSRSNTELPLRFFPAVVVQRVSQPPSDLFVKRKMRWYHLIWF